MDFMYLFIVILLVWAFSIMSAVTKFKFLALPVILFDVTFLVSQVVANEFPEWRVFIILTIILTLTFSGLAIVGGNGD